MNQTVQPHSAAERAKRYRQRQRDGACILQIEVAGADVAGFIDLGVLSPEQRDDPAAIRRAIAQLCRCGCRHWPDDITTKPR